jgi:hypothetical protein
MREKLIELLKESGVAFPISTANFLVANGVTFAKDNDVPNKWIPVAERLPEGFGTYLVAIDEVHGENRVSVDAADFDPFEKRWSTFGYFCAGYKVTHWMPLPEPPKEG